MAPYPPTRKLGRSHPTPGGSSQVIRVDEGSPIWTLTVYEASLGDQDDVFDVDLPDDIIDKGLKPIE